MEKRVALPYFDGMWIDLIWDTGSNVNTVVENNTVIINGNDIGIHSIAKQMLYFSRNSFPPGSHVHYDSWLPYWRGYSLVMSVVGKTFSLYDYIDESSLPIQLPIIGKNLFTLPKNAFFSVSVRDEITIEANQSGYYHVGCIMESLIESSIQSGDGSLIEPQTRINRRTVP